MALWRKLTRVDTDKPVWVNLSHAIMIEASNLRPGEKGSAIHFEAQQLAEKRGEHAPMVKAPLFVKEEPRDVLGPDADRDFVEHG